MKILILGKNGNIGSFLTRYLKLSKPYKIYSFDKKTVDITNIDDIYKIIYTYEPNYIINCTAFLNADRCEEYKDISYNVNYKGVVNIAKAINKIDKNIKFLHFSTDFVFYGNKKECYKENDIPIPRNIYGLHKYLADECISNSLENYLILRVASLLNFKSKNNFAHKIIELYRRNNEIKLVNDLKISLTTLLLINRFITYILDSNILIPGIYNLVSDGKTSWYEIGRYILEKKFKNKVNMENIKKISFKEFPLKAVRPLNSCLDNSVIKKVYNFNIQSWEEELDEYCEFIR